jgi:hypothetical protein
MSRLSHSLVLMVIRPKDLSLYLRLSRQNGGLANGMTKGKTLGY